MTVTRTTVTHPAYGGTLTLHHVGNAYVVRANLRTYAPARWQGTRQCALFGERNEGVEVTAASADDAVRTYAAANRLNPFYLEASPA